MVLMVPGGGVVDVADHNMHMHHRFQQQKSVDIRSYHQLFIVQLQHINRELRNQFSQVEISKCQGNFDYKLTDLHRWNRDLPEDFSEKNCNHCSATQHCAVV